MSLSLNFNLGAVRAHQHLRDADRLLNGTIERLSSGLRINRAGDDAAGLVIANSLRYHLKGIDAAVGNAESAVTMLQTAEGSMDELSSLMNKIRELALGAANDGVNDAQQLVAYQEELDQAIASVTRIAADTRYGGTPLLDGTYEGMSLTAADKEAIRRNSIDHTRLPGGISPTATADIGTVVQARGTGSVTFAGAPASSATIVGLTQDGVPLTAAPGGTTLTVQAPRGSVVVSLTGATTIAGVVAAVNAVSSSIGAVAAYDAAAGRLSITASEPGVFSLTVNNDMSGGANVGLLDSDTTATGINSVLSTVSDSTIEGYLATFAGPPAGSAAIQGSVQDGTTLDAVAGGTVTVEGPLATRTYTLGATTSFDQFVALVNADSTVTGAFASYDAINGRLRIDNTLSATGPLRVRASDMTSGGSTIGLLDSDTSNAVNTFAVPTSNLKRERVAVNLLTGASAIPALTDTINGLSQDGQALSIAGGETVAITGPRGAATITLVPSTTIAGFLASVNSRSAQIGARATYDTATGELALESLHFGSGALQISSSDAVSGAPTVGLLDGDTTDALLNPFGPPRDVFAMSFANPGPGTPAVSLDDAVFGLTGNGVAFDDVFDPVAGKGRQLTVFGNGDQATLELAEPTSAETIARWIADRTGNTFFNGITDTLEVYDTATGSAVLAASFAVTATTSWQELATALNGSATFTSLAGVTAAVSNRTFTLTPTAAAAPVSGAVTTADSLATFYAANSQHTVYANGELSVYDDGQPIAQRIGDALTIDAATTLAEVIAFANTADRTEQTRAVLSEVAGTATVTYLAEDAGTLALTGTTLRDVVDFVNAKTSELGTLAVFTPASGPTPAEIRITGSKGSIAVQSERMTTAASNTGLFDLDTTSIDATGTPGNDTRLSRAPNRTLTYRYTDARGTTHDVLLTQIPTKDGGTTFTNLNAGPELGPPFTGWKAGAFSVTYRDTTAATGSVPGSVIAMPTAAVVATRESEFRFQLGPIDGQSVTVEIPDLRAGALGYTAMRNRLGSADFDDQRFLALGLYSLQDLADKKALQNGHADEAILVIDAAIDEITKARGRVGAMQSAGVESTLASLRAAFENTTEAESRIRDADFAAESATYAKQNVILQAGIAMLAQANQVPQSVLQLLR